MRVLNHHILLSILLFSFFLCLVNTSSVYGQNGGFSFDSAEDFADYLYKPKRFQGNGPIFSGVIELRDNGEQYCVYVNDKFLSVLGFVGRSQKFCYGDYVRMSVYVEGRTYPVVVHLPDSQHPYEYFYFEPIETSTNSNLASALNLPVTNGWLWVEPDIQNGKAKLIWHTDSKTKPSPIIYKRMR